MVDSNQGANMNVPDKRGTGKWLVHLYLGCPKTPGTCCSAAEREKSNYWYWGGDTSNPTYIDAHGMLSSLKNDYSMHLFDAKFKCSDSNIATQADPGVLMVTIGTYVEKIALQKDLAEKRKDGTSELELKLLFYTNLGSRMATEYTKRYPVKKYICI